MHLGLPGSGRQQVCWASSFLWRAEPGAAGIPRPRGALCSVQGRRGLPSAFGGVLRGSTFPLPHHRLTTTAPPASWGPMAVFLPQARLGGAGGAGWVKAWDALLGAHMAPGGGMGGRPGLTVNLHCSSGCSLAVRGWETRSLRPLTKAPRLAGSGSQAWELKN